MIIVFAFGFLLGVGIGRIATRKQVPVISPILDRLPLASEEVVFAEPVEKKIDNIQDFDALFPL